MAFLFDIGRARASGLSDKQIQDFIKKKEKESGEKAEIIDSVKVSEQRAQREAAGPRKVGGLKGTVAGLAPVLGSILGGMGGGAVGALGGPAGVFVGASAGAAGGANIGTRIRQDLAGQHLTGEEKAKERQLETALGLLGPTVGKGLQIGGKTAAWAGKPILSRVFTKVPGIGRSVDDIAAAGGRVAEDFTQGARTAAAREGFDPATTNFSKSLNLRKEDIAKIPGGLKTIKRLRDYGVNFGNTKRASEISKTMVGETDEYIGELTRINRLGLETADEAVQAGKLPPVVANLDEVKQLLNTPELGISKAQQKLILRDLTTNIEKLGSGGTLDQLLPSQADRVAKAFSSRAANIALQGGDNIQPVAAATRAALDKASNLLRKAAYEKIDGKIMKELVADDDFQRITGRISKKLLSNIVSDPDPVKLGRIASDFVSLDKAASLGQMNIAGTGGEPIGVLATIARGAGPVTRRGRNFVSRFGPTADDVASRPTRPPAGQQFPTLARAFNLTQGGMRRPSVQAIGQVAARQPPVQGTVSRLLGTGGDRPQDIGAEPTTMFPELQGETGGPSQVATLPDGRTISRQQLDDAITMDIINGGGNQSQLEALRDQLFGEEGADFSAEQEKRLRQINETRDTVNYLGRDLLENIGAGQLPVLSRIGGAGRRGGAALGFDPGLKSFMDLRESLRSRIARGQGEVGNLTETEQQVALQALPNIGDTEAEVIEKLRKFNELMAIAEQRTKESLQ